MVAAPPLKRGGRAGKPPPARNAHAGSSKGPAGKPAGKPAGDRRRGGPPRDDEPDRPPHPAAKKPREPVPVDVGRAARLLPAGESGGAAGAPAQAVIEFGWADEAGKKGGAAASSGGRRAKAERDRKKKLKPGSFGERERGES